MYGIIYNLYEQQGKNVMSVTREKNFDKNGFYDENEELLLIEPNDTYKDAYFDLCKETYCVYPIL